MAEQTPTLRKRFRFMRFSLRALLAAATLVAVALGLWVEGARRQRLAAEELRELGASVKYDFEVKRTDDGWYEVVGPFDLDEPSVSRVSAPLEDWLGIDFFHTVRYVSLHARRKPETIEPLTRLRGLRHVRFPWNGPMDDEPLKETRRRLPPANEDVDVDPAVVAW